VLNPQVKFRLSSYAIIDRQDCNMYFYENNVKFLVGYIY